MERDLFLLSNLVVFLMFDSKAVIVLSLVLLQNYTTLF